MKTDVKLRFQWADSVEEAAYFKKLRRNYSAGFYQLEKSHGGYRVLFIRDNVCGWTIRTIVADNVSARAIAAALRRDHRLQLFIGDSNRVIDFRAVCGHA